jgi:hypothetical protein
MQISTDIYLMIAISFFMRMYLQCLLMCLKFFVSVSTRIDGPSPKNRDCKGQTLLTLRVIDAYDEYDDAGMRR